MRRKPFLLDLITRALLLCAFCCLAGRGTELRAQSTGVSEYELKAACLFKFLQFVKFPAAPGTSMTIGILGEDPFGGTLESTLKGEKLTFKRSRRAEDLRNCQLIFVAKSERGNLAGILASLVGASVLTVGETEGFARQGGVIGFRMDGDKVRFEINAAAARKAGLEIRAGLLRLASPVINP